MLNEDSPPHEQEESDPPRKAERADENLRYTPVILKRVDAATRHPDDVLELAIEEGVEQSSRRPMSLLLSSVAAGSILSFTAMAVGVMTVYTQSLGDPVLGRLLVALVYPLGFVVCLMSGNQLFTEHTALAVYPVLERRCRFVHMLRVWALVLAGNLIGCLVGAALLAAADGVIHAAEGYAAACDHVIGYGGGPTLASAVLAGWMMALGGWLVLSTPPDFSQIAVIYIATFLIGIGGLHHSIAGSAEVLSALMTGHDASAAGVLAAITIAVIGNLLGGSIFVALLNYGHIRRTQEEPADE